MTADAAGNLFGTTAFGGAGGGGTVFEIPKNTAGYGALITLASFTGGNGLYPSGTLITDAVGDLFGTAQNGAGRGFVSATPSRVLVADLNAALAQKPMRAN